jgi:hypothetical protein
MAIKYLQGDAPNYPTLDRSTLREGWNFRRGKVTRQPRASWDMRDGNGKPLDPEIARKVLDETERN